MRDTFIISSSLIWPMCITPEGCNIQIGVNVCTYAVRKATAVICACTYIYIYINQQDAQNSCD